MGDASVAVKYIDYVGLNVIVKISLDKNKSLSMLNILSPKISPNLIFSISPLNYIFDGPTNKLASWVEKKLDFESALSEQ